MCGRYYIAAEDDSEEIRRIVEQLNRKLKGKPEQALLKTGEIFPTNAAPTLSRAGGVALMRWGFSGPGGKGQVINARSEGAAQRPMFREAMRSARCLVPASHYFEWEKRGAQKVKYALSLPGQPIYMAGLYRLEEADGLPRFVILTRPCAPGIAFIHDRMPVLLAGEARRAWMDETADPMAVLARAAQDVAYRPA